MGSPFQDDMAEFEEAIGEVLPAGVVPMVSTPDLTGEDGPACRYCGGPDDHGRDCLPASQGGTQPDLANDTPWPL